MQLALKEPHMGRLDPTYIPHFQAIQRGEYSDAVTKADWPGGGGVVASRRYTLGQQCYMMVLLV
jgi:hypothetical protein